MAAVLALRIVSIHSLCTGREKPSSRRTSTRSVRPAGGEGRLTDGVEARGGEMVEEEEEEAEEQWRQNKRRERRRRDARERQVV
jgi:hypothetical protein